MGDRSKIEWTDASWNPIRARNKATGKIGWHCEHKNAACVGCYAESMNRLRGTGLDFKPGHRKDIEIFLDEEFLLHPLRWKRPRRIFVCSMTDLFADFVTDDMIDRMFAVMALADQHTFQVLTKRPERMREYCSALQQRGIEIAQRAVWLGIWDDPDAAAVDALTAIDAGPLPNVWLGTTVHDQDSGDDLIPYLRATPATIRFISYEPALGPVDWRGHLAGPADLPRIHQIIAGGESGNKARPAHPDWFRQTRDQCAAAGAAFFFKQWGEFSPDDAYVSSFSAVYHVWSNGDSCAYAKLGTGGYTRTHGDGHLTMARVGKKAAGRMLDGRTHDEFPEPRS